MNGPEKVEVEQKDEGGQEDLKENELKDGKNPTPKSNDNCDHAQLLPPTVSSSAARVKEIHKMNGSDGVDVEQKEKKVVITREGESKENEVKDQETQTPTSKDIRDHSVVHLHLPLPTIAPLSAAPGQARMELRINGSHARKQVESYKREMCRLGIANSQTTVKHFSDIAHTAANNLVQLLHFRGTPTSPMVIDDEIGSLFDWLMRYGAEEHLATREENEDAREDPNFGLLRLASLQYVFMSHAPNGYRLEFLEALLFRTVRWTPCDRLKKLKKMVRRGTHHVVQVRFLEYIDLCTSEAHANDFDTTRGRKLVLL